MSAVATDEQFTPQAVRFRQFRTVRRNGFDPDEVATFLYDLAEEISRRDDREAALRAVADRLDRENRKLRELAGGTDSQIPVAATLVRSQPEPEAIQLMTRAQSQADQLIARARDQAHAIVADARQRAAAIYSQAQNTAGDKVMKMIGFTDSDMAADISERAEKLKLAEETLTKAKGEFLADIQDVLIAVEDARSVLATSNGDDTTELPAPPPPPPV